MAGNILVVAWPNGNDFVFSTRMASWVSSFLCFKPIKSPFLIVITLCPAHTPDLSLPNCHRHQSTPLTGSSYSVVKDVLSGLHGNIYIYEENFEAHFFVVTVPPEQLRRTTSRFSLGHLAQKLSITHPIQTHLLTNTQIVRL